MVIIGHISNHAPLLRGATLRASLSSLVRAQHFNPRTYIGATQYPSRVVDVWRISIHTPYGATSPKRRILLQSRISIHALINMSTTAHSYAAMVLSVLTSFRFPIPCYRVSITDLILNVKGPEFDV